MKARGLDLSLPTMADCAEWLALRAGSKSYLSGVEPDWRDERLKEDFFATYVAESANAAKEGAGYSMLIRNAAGVLVGGVSLGPIKDGAGFLGTWIGEPFAGRGYAIRAADVILDIAFRVLGMSAVAATVMPDNDASMRGLEYFGFEHDPDRNLIMNVAGDPRLHLVYKVNRHGVERSQSKQCQRHIQRAA